MSWTSRRRKREAARHRMLQAAGGFVAPTTPPAGTGHTGPAVPQIYSVFPSANSAVAYSYTTLSTPEPTDLGMAIEPIVGWRAFTVREVQNLMGGSDFELVSLNGVPWPHRRPLEALCNGNLLADHDSPKVQCTCGIYAWNKDNRSNAYGNHAQLYGEVYLWGDVLICEHGYRAEIAYPKKLFIRNSGGTRLAAKVQAGLVDAYGVPVEFEPGTTPPEPNLMGFGRSNPFLTS